ncbi:peptide MFS transporter [Sinimarinibacterium sp. CAU 1509]|uniref:peptide MFS transporter n=1 Tax=Sinimarinibacterium sp. CAU 1509 TaxID=2562283 RepID=UPI0010ACC970|nr:peptide MFS transporter [Sinimarinibacterium sp. CAU 1509]TJY59780.1 peptide MFS transporter [Sinimarinibacterium sp. CAU 1509]
MTDKTWAGHPSGLSTLFFTEMWERFSYYGMRAILVLAMVAAVESGGMGMDDRTATAVYGIYTAGVYLLSLPGGWIADRLLGQRQAVWYGGILIASGHFTMALPLEPTFFVGMLLIVLGTGLLKPNISAMVGQLYAGDMGARRDAGFSLFYMGINIGSFFGQLICGFLGEKVGWHYGFGAAGVFMALGLVQYRRTGMRLGDVGLHVASSGDASRDARERQRGWTIVWIGMTLLLAVMLAALSGTMALDAIAIASAGVYVIVGGAGMFFLYVILFGGLDLAERKRVGVIAVFFVAAAVFWSGFEQAGSSFNLFADRYTDRMIFGWEMPASWLQSVNPMFIILLAPLFATLWVQLGKRNMDPSIPAKFSLGLVQMGLGFLVLYFASIYVVQGEKVLPTWLCLTYLLHTTGELCLSPVGLSAVTKLAPKRYVGQMMGTWFMGASLGNLIGGLIAGHFGEDNVAEMPARFMTVFLTTAGFGVLLALFIAPIRNLAGKTEAPGP